MLNQLFIRVGSVQKGRLGFLSSGGQISLITSVFSLSYEAGPHQNQQLSASFALATHQNFSSVVVLSQVLLLYGSYYNCYNTTTTTTTTTTATTTTTTIVTTAATTSTTTTTTTNYY